MQGTKTEARELSCSEAKQRETSKTAPSRKVASLGKSRGVYAVNTHGERAVKGEGGWQQMPAGSDETFVSQGWALAHQIKPGPGRVLRREPVGSTTSASGRGDVHISEDSWSYEGWRNDDFPKTSMDFKVHD